jgi:hypothetical protein
MAFLRALRAAGLSQGTYWLLFRPGHPLQEVPYIGETHLGRMTHVVEQNEAPLPVHKLSNGWFVMAALACRKAHLVEQSWSRKRRQVTLP